MDKFLLECVLKNLGITFLMRHLPREEIFISICFCLQVIPFDTSKEAPEDGVISMDYILMELRLGQNKVSSFNCKDSLAVAES